MRSVDFIKRYIFPGGCLPSVGAMLDATRRATDFSLVHFEDITPHYAETLRLWRERFHARLDDVRSLGYSREFTRMWDFYLAYCEGAFRERWVGAAQLKLSRPLCRRRPVLGALPAAEEVERAAAADPARPADPANPAGAGRVEAPGTGGRSPRSDRGDSPVYVRSGGA